MTAFGVAVRRLTILCAPMLCTFIQIDRGDCADWPQFLGPQRTGVSEESDLVDEFGVLGSVHRLKQGFSHPIQALCSFLLQMPFISIFNWKST